MSYTPNNPNGSTLSANSAPVVIASDQGGIPFVVPMVIAQPSSQSLATTGSIQWTVEAGGWYYLTITNAPAATATFVATVVFETSPDNSVWTAVNGNPVIGLPGAGLASVSTTSTVGLWKIQVPGNTPYIRARVSARTSGTIWAFLEPVGVPNGNIQLPFTPSVTTANTLVGWIDTSGISELSIQISGITATVVTVQGTNDPTGTTVQSIQTISDNTPNQATATTIFATGSYSITNPVHKWVRFQVTTTGTVLTIQGATARFGQSMKLNAAQSSIGIQGSPTIGTVSTVTTVSTVASVSKSNLAQPGFVQDVASAAITTTATTGNITPSFGSSYQVTIPVTAVSGTNPTYDVEIQESRDNGTNWVPVYDFPRITAVGQYTSPILTMSGSLMRYLQTVGGTTPSFTRAIQRDQGNISTVTLVRQIIDRTIVLTTLNSNTVNLVVEQGTRNLQMTINIGAVTTTAPVLQVMASDDAGASWYAIPGTSLTTVASSTVSLTINGVTAQLFRATVTTAGVGVTAGYVLLRAY
jgi:hypothetical protein